MYHAQEEKEEVQNILEAADDIGAAAVSVASQGGQGYNSLLEARDRFKKLLLTAAAHYRICVEEDEESVIQ